MEYDDVGCPKAQGLYDPQNEKDACGVGFVVNIKGVATRKVRGPKLFTLHCHLFIFYYEMVRKFSYHTSRAAVF